MIQKSVIFVFVAVFSVFPLTASAATVSFSNPAGYSVLEGETIYVGVRIGATDAPVTVRIKVTGGSAVSGVDFQNPGEVDIPFVTGGPLGLGIGFKTLANAGTGPKTVVMSVVKIGNDTVSVPTATITIRDGAPPVSLVSTTLDCPPPPASWTTRIPLLYLPGGTSPVQIGKPMTVSVRAITADADVTSDDSQVNGALTASPKVRIGGTAAGAFAFDQTITVTGSPRTVTFRSSAGGLFQAVCGSVQVQRAAVTRQLSLAVDKTVIGPLESFNMTVSGLPSNSSDFDGGLSTSGPIDCFTMDGYGGAFNNSTRSDGAGQVKYLCYRNLRGSSVSVDTNYTARYTARSVLDVFTPSNTVSFQILKTGSANGLTSYGSCSSGKGVDPVRPWEGCKECVYIAGNHRSNITTCQSVAGDAYTWTSISRTGYLGALPATCASQNLSPVAGAACTNGQRCVSSTHLFTCGLANAPSFRYYGKVTDKLDASLVGVGVDMMFISGSGSNPWRTTTDSEGNYSFPTTIGSLCAYNACLLTFTKSGYVTTNAWSRAGEQNTVKMETARPIVTTPALSASASTVTLTIPTDNQVTVTLYNAQVGDLDVCHEITAYPANPSIVNTGLCNTSAGFSSFSGFEGNSDWTFEGANLVGRFTKAKYQSLVGIESKAVFRKKSSPTNTIPIQFRVVGSVATPAIGALSISPTSATLDVNGSQTVTITLANAQSGDLQTCLQVAPSTACESSSPPFVNFNGNSDWAFAGNNLIGTFPPGNTWRGAVGIQSKAFFRKISSPSNIVSVSLSVVAIPVSVSVWSSTVGVVTTSISNWWDSILSAFGR